MTRIKLRSHTHSSVRGLLQYLDNPTVSTCVRTLVYERAFLSRQDCRRCRAVPRLANVPNEAGNLHNKKRRYICCSTQDATDIHARCSGEDNHAHRWRCHEIPLNRTQQSKTVYRHAVRALTHATEHGWFLSKPNSTTKSYFLRWHLSRQGGHTNRPAILAMPTEWTTTQAPVTDILLGLH